MSRCRNIGWSGRQENLVDKSRGEPLKLITDIMWSESLCRKIHLTVVASRGNKLQ